MSDLKSKPWIVAKGGLFFLMIVLCSVLILQQTPKIQTVLILLLLIWSSARFYYFLFYVLEQYVDPTLKYAGVLALLQEIWKRVFARTTDSSRVGKDRLQP